MEILYILLYIIGTAIVVLILLWVIGIVLNAFGITIPNNIRMLIGLFLLIVILLILFNAYPVSNFGGHHIRV